MNKESINKYFIDEIREEEIWKDCIFIFDTSALLNFYNYSPQTKDFFFKQVFPKLHGRLWIPNHVEFEFLKNRLKTLKNPIKEKYEKLLEDDINPLIELLKKAEAKLTNIKDKTKKKFAHPYFDQNIFKSYDQLKAQSEKEFNQLIENIKKEIEIRKEEILKVSDSDDVLAAIESFFTTGKPFSFENLLAISKEGEFRYKLKIPPGYDDIEIKSGKTGLQVFGDLIIWKQILEYGRIITKPLVLITDDVKSDWCYIEKNGRDIKITRPREELIKELYDFASVDFWMYTLSQFLYHIDKKYSIKPKEDIVLDVESNIKNNPITYSSFYYSPDNDCMHLLRFFEDGNVISVALGDDILNKSTQERVEKWFRNGYENSGRYKIFENQIEFNTRSTQGIVEYIGKIEENILQLKVKSQINGNISNRKYLLLESSNSISK